MNNSNLPHRLNAKICYILLVLMLSTKLSYSQEAPLAYRLYDANGKLTDWSTLVKTTAKADVVFFGELHNQSQIHWLQLQLAKALWTAKKGQLSIGYEMIETDRQAALDSLSKGQITEEEFAKHSRMWPNYDTDYKPIVTWGIKNNLRQVASNCPRRYASLVHKQGMEALLKLDSATKGLLAPLPYASDTSLPGYKAMLTMMGGHGQRAYQMVQAQAIKDATMAYRIVQNHQAGTTLLHLNGSYHSDNYEGILAHLLTYRRAAKQPDLKVVTISTAMSETELKPRDKTYTPSADKKADFYLLIPSDAPTSY